MLSHKTIKKSALVGVPFYNAFANRQTYAGTRIFFAVQAFEYAEDLLGICRLDADSVIPHQNERPTVLAFR
jgi:hypothetical protein